MKRIFVYFLSSILSIHWILLHSPAQADISSLPPIGTALGLTQAYNPAIIKGLTVHPTDPFQMSFMMDSGDEKLSEEAFQETAIKQIKYFMAALAIPEQQMWVNLSPYEQNRIIPEVLGQTDMGKDMLIQDYLLKQLSSSLMSPQNEIGQQFWKKVYDENYEKLGSTDIPVETFNKIWIVPGSAGIYVHEQNVFITDSKLKVMLEDDYLAMEMNQGRGDHELDNLKKDKLKGLEISTETIREVIIPVIEKEVNEGQIFANLRQIYHAIILATWYKQNLKDSFLGQIYSDHSEVEFFALMDKQAKQQIYEQYVQAF